MAKKKRKRKKSYAGLFFSTFIKVMLIFVLIGKLIDRDAHNISLLSFVAFLMLVFNPLYINDVSFQMSFLVTLGLILCVDVFSNKLDKIPNIVKVKYQCVTANNGYAVGDYIETIYASDTIGLTSINDSISVTITTVTLHPGSVGSTLYVKHKSTGALSSTSNGYWKAIIYCSRGW